MLKFLLVAALVAAITGCGNPEGEQRTYVENKHFCTQETAQQRANFILRCVEGANPKSDEELEDWIRHCQYMAEQTLCKTQQLAVVEECQSGGSLFGICNLWREVSRAPLSN